MKKIVVAMYDEEGYTRRLADYFCQHQKNLFDVRLFTSEESLRKFLIGQGTELLITGERDWELFRGIKTMDRPCCLSINLRKVCCRRYWRSWLTMRNLRFPFPKSR